MVLDIASVRAGFPALADGRAHLDAAAGSLVPASVIDAIATAQRAGLGNTGGYFPSSQRSEEVVEGARRAVADLVGGQPSGVVLGPNMTTLTYRFSSILAAGWGPGDHIILSELDHDANLRPWMQAADRAGVSVSVARVDPKTGELPVAEYEELVGPRTRLVAVTGASNVLGTRPAVREICRIAHREGALTYVDGVHLTPHAPIDIGELGADFYITSSYKWGGPHLGALVADPQLLEELHPDKLAPASDSVPDRFQTGTPPFAAFAGLIAAVDHLAQLAGGVSGSRRDRILASMASVQLYESELFRDLWSGLEEIPGISTYGHAAQRTPTAFFRLEGRSPDDVARALAERGVDVWSGDNYAFEVVRALGLAPEGAIRAGLFHYNDHTDVQRLLQLLAEV